MNGYLYRLSLQATSRLLLASICFCLSYKIVFHKVLNAKKINKNVFIKSNLLSLLKGQILKFPLVGTFLVNVDFASLRSQIQMSNFIFIQKYIFNTGVWLCHLLYSSISKMFFFILAVSL